MTKKEHEKAVATKWKSLDRKVRREKTKAYGRGKKREKKDPMRKAARSWRSGW